LLRRGYRLGGGLRAQLLQELEITLEGLEVHGGLDRFGLTFTIGSYPTDAGFQAADDASRNTADNGVVGDVAPNHRPRGDHHVAADDGPRKHDRAVPDPGAVADPHRGVDAELPADGRGRILVAVVGVGHEHVLAEPDVIADLYRLVRHDTGSHPHDRPIAHHQSPGVQLRLIR